MCVCAWPGREVDSYRTLGLALVDLVGGHSDLL
jgi:hypothetical protein